MPHIGRLKTRADFLRTAKLGRKWVTPAFVLQALSQKTIAVENADEGLQAANKMPHSLPAGPNATDYAYEPGSIRIGFTASKKIGSAVQRNRAKRRLREAASMILPDEGQPGMDYVLVARPKLLDISFDQLKSDLAYALKQVKKGHAQHITHHNTRAKYKGKKS